MDTDFKLLLGKKCQPYKAEKMEKPMAYKLGLIYIATAIAMKFCKFECAFIPSHILSFQASLSYFCQIGLI